MDWAGAGRIRFPHLPAISGTSPDRLFTVGTTGLSSSPYVYQWNGERASDMRFPLNYPHAVTTLPSGEVFTCGDRGSFARWDLDLGIRLDTSGFICPGRSLWLDAYFENPGSSLHDIPVLILLEIDIYEIKVSP